MKGNKVHVCLKQESSGWVKVWTGVFVACRRRRSCRWGGGDHALIHQLLIQSRCCYSQQIDSPVNSASWFKVQEENCQLPISHYRSSINAVDSLVSQFVMEGRFSRSNAASEGRRPRVETQDSCWEQCEKEIIKFQANKTKTVCLETLKRSGNRQSNIYLWVH